MIKFLKIFIDRTIFWFKAARLYSAPITFLSWLVIFVYSLKQGGAILNGIIALVGISFVHLATNLIDDYIDYKVLQKDNKFITAGRDCKCEYLRSGKATIRDLRNIIIIFLTIAAFCGGILFFISGPAVLLLAIIALVIALGYPHLSCRGLGEVEIIIAYGPLMFEGVYYVMTRQFSLDVFILSLVCVMFVNAILYAHMLMDYDGDLNANKTTLCIKMGSKDRALKLLLVFYGFSYIVLGYFIFKTQNLLFLLNYLTIPLVVDLYSMLKKYNTDPTSVPQVRFWHQPLENWNKVKNTTNAPFYLRFFFARNISTLFMLLTCLAILFG